MGKCPVQLQPWQLQLYPTTCGYLKSSKCFHGWHASGLLPAVVYGSPAYVLASQVHLLDGLDSQAFPLCVQPRSPGLEYFVEHQAGHLLLLANRSTAPGFNPEPTAEAAHASAPANSPAADAEVQDYSLFTVPVAALHPGSAAHGQPWLLQVAESPGVAITDIEVFDGVAVLHELRGGQPAVRLLHLEAQPGKPLSISKQQQVSAPARKVYRHYFASCPGHQRMKAQAGQICFDCVGVQAGQGGGNMFSGHKQPPGWCPIKGIGGIQCDHPSMQFFPVLLGPAGTCKPCHPATTTTAYLWRLLKIVTLLQLL